MKIVNFHHFITQYINENILQENCKNNLLFSEFDEQNYQFTSQLQEFQQDFNIEKEKEIQQYSTYQEILNYDQIKDYNQNIDINSKQQGSSYFPQNVTQNQIEDQIKEENLNKSHLNIFQHDWIFELQSEQNLNTQENQLDQNQVKQEFQELQENQESQQNQNTISNTSTPQKCNTNQEFEIFDKQKRELDQKQLEENYDDNLQQTAKKQQKFDQIKSYSNPTPKKSEYFQHNNNFLNKNQNDKISQLQVQMQQQQEKQQQQQKQFNYLTPAKSNLINNKQRNTNTVNSYYKKKYPSHQSLLFVDQNLKIG
ncbi:hypothetical protein PPERSA_05051 [Pseudocohnilembus persalinus]|uniref:Uncharacterized protein n=1 Tax=Pseudocohnilembus persalinus TaxID=266149 RepID=A0A0V0QW64_PSEPJ|nr:hypothetical protein PPERSA_05051 [Pseudocohnilembus persalinus]|eukprot:KRX06438.1 hypothetical protein PPERSA_05051 [Pseudocohnilembus persalinus]